MPDSTERTIGEFVALGVIRWLTASSPFAQQHRLGVVSLGANNAQHRGEGSLRVVDVRGPGAELDGEEADALRSLDPGLFDRLRRMSAPGDRSPSALVDIGVLPPATVCVDGGLVFDGLERRDRAARLVRRERWFHQAMVSVGSCSLVVVETAAGRHVTGVACVEAVDPTDRHVHLPEIGALIERGQSVVMRHQADPSLPVEAQVASTMADVHAGLGVEPLAVVQAPRSTSEFLVVVPHPRHRRDLEDRLGALQMSRWGDELRLHRWQRAALSV